MKCFREDKTLTTLNNNDIETIDDWDENKVDVKPIIDENIYKLYESDDNIDNNNNDPDYEEPNNIATESLNSKKKDKQTTLKSVLETSSNGLTQKTKTRSRKRNIPSDTDSDSNDRKASKELVPTIACDYEDCDRVFKTAKSYETHKRLVHLKIKSFVCPHPDCKFTAVKKYYLIQHSSMHSNEKPFVCEVNDCGKRFKLRIQLLAHQKFVHKMVEELLKCEWPGCGYESARRRDIQSHMKIHTITEKSVACDWPECSRMFKTEEAMRDHRRIHTAPKKFCCTWPGCDFKAYKPHIQKQHMLVHSDLRPFTCDIDDCGKSFKTAVVLEAHKRRHFPVVNASRDFKCEVEGCGKDFRTKVDLKLHSRSHMPANLRCEWPGCTYATAKPGNLKKHQYVHADYNERKYVCVWPECGKRFTDKARLDDHFRQHTNDRRHACSYPGCGYRCVVKANLRKHMCKHLK